jgi:hypothetical protein
MKTISRLMISAIALGLLTACATPAPGPTSVPVVATTRAPKRNLTSIPPSTASAVTTETPITAASGAAGTGAQVPSSCSALVSLVGAYMGGVATTKSLGSPQHLSCEFANANASTIVIVNIEVGGTVAAFDALRATSAQGGRTVTSISGLGSSAFSVSKNGVPAGVSVLTAQGLVYAVESNLSLAQAEALIEQLMKLS